MGIIEVDKSKAQIYIYSDFYFYGDAADEEIRKNSEEEINTLWNEPKALVWLNNYPYLVNFVCQSFIQSTITPFDIINNTNPRNNYFRVEEFCQIDISFVDGINSNTGYFKHDNLYKGSTTIAHEYGHTIGLDHPMLLDIRGEGLPGIMYPRGTLVDPIYQYDETAVAGEKGGTIHPQKRKVLQKDIDLLYLDNVIKNKKNTIGGFSNIYHQKHKPLV